MFTNNIVLGANVVLAVVRENFFVGALPKVRKVRKSARKAMAISSRKANRVLKGDKVRRTKGVNRRRRAQECVLIPDWTKKEAVVQIEKVVYTKPKKIIPLMKKSKVKQYRVNTVTYRSSYKGRYDSIGILESLRIGDGKPKQKKVLEKVMYCAIETDIPANSGIANLSEEKFEIFRDDIIDLLRQWSINLEQGDTNEYDSDNFIIRMKQYSDSRMAVSVITHELVHYIQKSGENLLIERLEKASTMLEGKFPELEELIKDESEEEKVAYRIMYEPKFFEAIVTGEELPMEGKVEIPKIEGVSYVDTSVERSVETPTRVKPSNGVVKKGKKKDKKEGKQFLKQPAWVEGRTIEAVNKSIATSMQYNRSTKPEEALVALANAFTLVGKTILPFKWLKGVRIDETDDAILKHSVKGSNNAVVKALFDLGVPMEGTRTSWEKDDKGGAVKTAKPIEVVVEYSLYKKSRINGERSYMLIHAAKDENAYKPLLNMDNLIQDMIDHIEDVVSNLDDEELLLFWNTVIPKSRIDGKAVVFSLDESATYDKVVIQLPEDRVGLIKVITGGMDSNGNARDKERRANPSVDVFGKTVSSKAVITVIMMGLMGSVLKDVRINGYLDLFSNFWVPAENYGAFKEEGETLHCIHSNRNLPVTVQPVSKYPFIHMVNVGAESGEIASTSRSQKLIEEGTIALPHKNCLFKDAVVVGAGVNAMGMAIAKRDGKFEGGLRDESGKVIVKGTFDRDELKERWEELLIRTILDASKPSKFFNRPWTFFGSTFANGTDEHPLERSNLRFITRQLVGKKGEETEEIRVKHVRGVRRKVVYSNSRLTHGSGVASYNVYSDPISYAVAKAEQGLINDYMIPPTAITQCRQEAERRSAAGVPTVWMDIIAEKLQEKANKIVEEAKEKNKVYRSGDVIMSIFENSIEYRRDVLVVSSNNQDIYLERAEVTRVATSDAVRVRFITNFKGVDFSLKLRGPGVKFTTILDRISFSSIREDEWDILLNMECVKGDLALLYMFAEEMGEMHYDPETGILTVIKDGRTIDLNDTKSEFYQWVKSKTRVEVITRKVKKAYLDYIAKCHPGTIAYSLSERTDKTDIVVIGQPMKDAVDEGELVYTVQETVQVVKGEMLFMVEISTPRENTSPAGMTLEQLALLECINPDLSSAFIHLSRSFHEGVLGMANVILNKIPENAVRMDLTQAMKVVREVKMSEIETEEEKEERRQELAESLNAKLGIKSGKKKSGKLLMGRSLIRKLEERFPKGIVIISSETVAVYYDFNSILRFSAFSGESGGSGMAGDIARFFHDLGTDPKQIQGGIDVWMTDMDRRNAVIFGQMYMWVTQMSGDGNKGSKVLARLGRTAKLGSNLKIKTTHNLVGYKHGIPVIGFNPKCASVRDLNIKDGDIIMAGRTPMGSPVFCYAKLSNKFPIAHGVMLAHVWAMANEGDGDGDPMFIFNIRDLIRRDNEWKREEAKKFSKKSEEFRANGLFDLALKYQDLAIEMVPCEPISYEKAAKMNNNMFSLAGYYTVYGVETDHPFAEFCSPSEKWGKKVLSGNPDLVLGAYRGIAKDKKSLVTNIPVLEYLNASDEVASHYRINVGVGYGVASALTFMLCEYKFHMMLKVAYEMQEEGKNVQVLRGGTQIIVEDECEIELKTRMNKDNVLVNLSKATAVAWRLIYEGLGLAGYTPDAKQFFKALAIATNDKAGMISVKTLPGGEVEIDRPREESAEEVMDKSTVQNYFGYDYLTRMMHGSRPEVMKNMYEATKFIIEARAAAMCSSRYNREGSVVPNALAKTDITTVVVTGAARALGQGRYGGSEVEEFEGGETTVISIFAELETIKGGNNNKYPVHSIVLKNSFILSSEIMAHLAFTMAANRRFMDQ